MRTQRTYRGMPSSTRTYFYFSDMTNVIFSHKHTNDFLSSSIDNVSSLVHALLYFSYVLYFNNIIFIALSLSLSMSYHLSLSLSVTPCFSLYLLYRLCLSLFLLLSVTLSNTLSSCPSLSMHPGYHDSNNPFHGQYQQQHVLQQQGAFVPNAAIAGNFLILSDC